MMSSRRPTRPDATEMCGGQNPTSASARVGSGSSSPRGDGRHRGRSGAATTSPASVWLCTPGPGEPDPDLPRWATGVIEEFSEPGDRVIVRSLGNYPSLPGEVAALIGAALALGRRPVALLPTPAAAARTRRLLPATTATENNACQSVATIPTGHLAIVRNKTAIEAVAADSSIENADMATTPLDVATATTLATTLATDISVATSTPMATSTAAATSTARDTATNGATPMASADLKATGIGAEVDAGGLVEAGAAQVAVGRRRPAREAGPAGLVVVLAGPVAPGARPAGRRPIPARVLAGWARPLRPGGVMTLLAPPPLGQKRWGQRRFLTRSLSSFDTTNDPRGVDGVASSGGGLVGALQEAGLSYTQHIVLVHAPTGPEGLLAPTDNPRRPHAPFLPVHTDLFVALSPADPFDPDETPPTGHNPAESKETL